MRQVTGTRGLDEVRRVRRVQIFDLLSWLGKDFKLRNPGSAFGVPSRAESVAGGRVPPLLLEDVLPLLQHPGVMTG